MNNQSQFVTSTYQAFFTTLFLVYIAFQIQGIELKVWIIPDITTNSAYEESILYGFNTSSRMEDLAHNPWIET